MSAPLQLDLFQNKVQRDARADPADRSESAAEAEASEPEQEVKEFSGSVMGG